MAGDDDARCRDRIRDIVVEHVRQRQIDHENASRKLEEAIQDERRKREEYTKTKELLQYLPNIKKRDAPSIDQNSCSVSKESKRHKVESNLDQDFYEKQGVDVDDDASSSSSSLESSSEGTDSIEEQGDLEKEKLLIHFTPAPEALANQDDIIREDVIVEPSASDMRELEEGLHVKLAAYRRKYKPDPKDSYPRLSDEGQAVLKLVYTVHKLKNYAHVARLYELCRIHTRSIDQTARRELYQFFANNQSIDLLNPIFQPLIVIVTPLVFWYGHYGRHARKTDGIIHSFEKITTRVRRNKYNKETNKSEVVVKARSKTIPILISVADTKELITVYIMAMHNLRKLCPSKDLFPDSLEFLLMFHTYKSMKKSEHSIGTPRGSTLTKLHELNYYYERYAFPDAMKRLEELKEL